MFSPGPGCPWCTPQCPMTQCAADPCSVADKSQGRTDGSRVTGSARAKRSSRILRGARGRQALGAGLELAQHVERPRARPFIAAAAETVPHAVDGARIEEL